MSVQSLEPEHFAVDVGYRDPLDERDDEPKDMPSMMDVDGIEVPVARWHVWDSEDPLDVTTEQDRDGDDEGD